MFNCSHTTRFISACDIWFVQRVYVVVETIKLNRNICEQKLKSSQTSSIKGESPYSPNYKMFILPIYFSSKFRLLLRSFVDKCLLHRPHRPAVCRASCSLSVEVDSSRLIGHWLRSIVSSCHGDEASPQPVECWFELWCRPTTGNSFMYWNWPHTCRVVSLQTDPSDSMLILNT